MAKKRVVGLDIGTTAVRAAEIEFGGDPRPGRGTLVRFAEVGLPLGAIRDGEVTDATAVTSALKQLWSEGKFQSKDVIVGIGNQRVVVRELSLPWMPMHELRASLPYQVSDMLPMSTSDALLDFFPTDEVSGPDGRTVEGLLVAAVKDSVSANVLAVESASLRPVMVDLNAFALLRGMGGMLVAGQTTALVDIGARITNVVIVEDTVPRFVRTLPYGGQDATDAVARALSISNADAERVKREIGVGFAPRPEHTEAAEALRYVSQNLVESVVSSFSYYTQQGGQISQLALSGGGSYLPGLGQYIASAARLKTVLGDPFGTVQLGRSAGSRESFAGREAQMVIPIGLAHGAAA